MSMPQSRRVRHLLPLLASLAGLAVAALPAAAVPQDINPDVSTSSNPNAATGGRVNHLASTPGNNQVFYLASELGGLFKSTNGGNNWAHLDNHLPQGTWDVAVDPSNTNRVYATSWYDGRVNTLAGIEVSTDAGANWTHPASAIAANGGPGDNTPDPGWGCGSAAQPSGHGIGIRPGANADVFVGTNCGVAISHDSGATWTFRDPTPATGASNVWDVSVQAGGPSGQGIVDTCGDDGHRRSTDGGVTWTGGTGGLPAGICSIAASPDEAYVLFVAASDNNVYESDDAGATWTNLGAPPSNQQGRIPFVVSNQRSDSGGNNVFDLWNSDVQLFRTGCTTPSPAAQGGANRCPAANTWTNEQNGAHWDGGDLEFDSQASVDACPVLFGSDGGVHTQVGASCQTPTWQRSNPGYHGVFLWTMSGQDQPGANDEDLYWGAQDVGFFATTNLGAATPTVSNPNCCDVFDTLAGPSWVLVTDCCYSVPPNPPGTRFNQIRLGNRGYTTSNQINTYPPGNTATFTWGHRMARFGSGNGVVIGTTSGVYFTNDITANPIVWTAFPALPAGAGQACDIQVSTSGGTDTFFVQTGSCSAFASDRLYTITGTGGTWARLDANGLTGGIGVFTVDPTNPARLYASNRVTTNPQMVFSTDGGQNWQDDAELDSMMTANGTFRYLTQQGPPTDTGTSSLAYAQPTMLAWDRENASVLVAGGADSGVFLSMDAGANWSRVTDPFNPGASGIAHLPRPRYAYFDHEVPAGGFSISVGTQGRGVWRLPFVQPVANAGGPYTTDEGQNVTLDASASSDPGGKALTFEWDLNGDGQYDDATGAQPVFDRVGQDGVYPVAVKVTNSDGIYATASTTVTVRNVPPAVTTLTSDGPKPENTPVTVSGVVSDPGWLDPLTATIDWGDGAGVQPLAGTLENVRPDATLTFSAPHTYGDNGTFTVTVCAADDDTSGNCRSIPVSVTNVDPTAGIDRSGATNVNGTPTIIGRAGQPVPFSGRSTDPGSDDLALSWSWGDGPPAPDVTTTYLNSLLFPLGDPYPSPTVNPRDVTDSRTHTFGDACLYTVSFSSRDDDGGSSPTDDVSVIITGTATKARSEGYWQHEFGRNGRTDFTVARLQCYLAIVQFVSTTFSEVRNASTIPAAFDVLFLAQNSGDERQKLDRDLITAWLNFANGAIAYGKLIDTNGDKVPDTPFSVVMANAETVRNNPASTPTQLQAQRQIVHGLQT